MLKSKVKHIGILTSGGDAPGMNTAIRAAVRTSIANGVEVTGILQGYTGLLTRKTIRLDISSVRDTMQRGGTILYSSRCLEFQEEANQLKAIEYCRSLNIDALIVLGGDGTFRGALALSRLGLPCVAIPATIDNNIAASEYSIGFDTACNTVIQMVDRLRDTSQSHNRCSVVEVMGGNSGYLALDAGIACGATAILMPEVNFDIEKDVLQRISDGLELGRQHFIIMVAEGAASAIELAKIIDHKTGIETKATVLGHVQRGGSPTAYERVTASEMGHHAVQMVLSGKSGRVVVRKDGKIDDMDIETALAMTKGIDESLYKVARDISL